MKNLAKLFSILFLFGIILSACEGPMGLTGANGEDGLDGTDGTASCGVCHDGNTITGFASQFATSQHYSGDIAVSYAGGRSGCAQCHGHEGYVEWATTGTVAANFSAPTAWQCATCHELHTDFDASDWSFRAGDAFTLIADGTTTFDQGNSNVCGNCHQARRDYDGYDNATEDKTYEREFDGADYDVYLHASVGPNGTIVDNGDGSLTVTFDVPVATHAYISSTHAGPHHGPQANMFVGVSAAPGVDGNVFGSHSGGCTMCHMGDDSNHSFMPKEENCTECHTNGIPETAMDEIEARLMAIGEALEAIHAVHYSDEDGTYHPMYASLTKDQFQAWWNFMFVLEDKSMGAHNPTFIRAMLFDAETKLGLI